MWWISSEGAAVAGHLRFGRSGVVGIFSLSFLLFFILGLIVLFAPAVFIVVSGGCYINIAGRKPISREI